MSPAKIGTLCIGLATLPLFAIAMTWLGPREAFGLSSNTGGAEAASGPTVGGNRDRFLAELTESYIRRGDVTITDAMRAGKQLAPTQFLNQELEQRGMKWRVRATMNLLAETYDVS
jgi:hypothetical protein